MKDQQTISIKTERDFINFLNKIDDEDFLLKTLVSAKKISVSFKLEGDKFNSSLSGALITALAEYQDKIYHIYKVQKYGVASKKRLSDEEMRVLEIKVDVKPGCTEAIIGFVKDIIPEVIKQMDGTEISKTAIAVTGIIAGAWALKGIAKPLIKNAFKTKQKELDAKIEVAKTDKEKEFLTSIKSITHDAIEGMRSVASGLIVANPDKVSIDGQSMSKNEISAISNEMAPPKKTDPTILKPDFYTVAGMFKVLEINYEKVVTLMKAVHIETGEMFADISLQDDWMQPESMAILKKAQARDPVYFRVSCQKDGRRYMHFIDVSSISESNPSKE